MRWSREPMVVALPSGHALARANRDAPIPLKALADETFIIYGEPHGPGIHAVAFRAFQAAGFNPLIGQQAPHLASTLNLVAVGLGVSFVPASLQRMHMDGVTYRQLRGAVRMSAPVNLVSRRGDPSVCGSELSQPRQKGRQKLMTTAVQGQSRRLPTVCCEEERTLAHHR